MLPQLQQALAELEVKSRQLDRRSWGCYCWRWLCCDCTEVFKLCKAWNCQRQLLLPMLLKLAKPGKVRALVHVSGHLPEPVIEPVVESNSVESRIRVTEPGQARPLRECRGCWIDFTARVQYTPKHADESYSPAEGAAV